jgi:hypothetical protein
MLVGDLTSDHPWNRLHESIGPAARRSNVVQPGTNLVVLAYGLPPAGALQCGGAANSWLIAILALDAIAPALLDPGTHSVDSARFGRRGITAPVNHPPRCRSCSTPWGHEFGEHDQEHGAMAITQGDGHGLPLQADDSCDR